MIKKLLQTLFCASLGVSLILTSCSMNTIEVFENVNNMQVAHEISDLPEILAFLRAQGVLSDDHYAIEGDLIVIEGCMELSLSDVREDMKNNDSRQNRHVYAVKQNYVYNVTVRIDSGVPWDWQYYIRQALHTWSNISGSKIRMYEVDQYEDVLIYMDSSLPDNVAARAKLPKSDGTAGYSIRINPLHNNLSHSQKNFVTVHELGHVIGFRHINVVENDTMHIQGTPMTDYSSIMRPVVTNWQGFSSSDMVAARLLYPLSGNFIEVFEDEWYQGKSYLIHEGHNVNVDKLESYGLNDKITSVKVYGNPYVKLCKNKDYEGANFIVHTGNTSDLSRVGLDNKVSSITWDNVPVNEPYVTLYTDQWYSGESYTISASDLNLHGVTEFGDRITSVKLFNGAKVMLYQHSYKGGASFFAKSDITNLKDHDFNDKASAVSFTVPTGAYAVCYQYSNYDGLPFTIWNDDSNLADSSSFNDMISSVKLYNGARIRLYEHKNYSGQSCYISSNTSYLGSSMDDEASSIRIYK